MRRSDVDEFWQRLFPRSRDHDALIVERPRNDSGVGQSKNSSSLLITRIFNPRGLTRIKQCRCGNQHGLLHSGYNYDLICMTARCSEIAQVSRECVAQIRIAAIRRITQQVGAFLRENLCSKPFPYPYWKFIDRRDTRDE